MDNNTNLFPIFPYTGKLDINGKNIAFGDFVTYTESLDEYGDKMPCCGVVVYDQSNACFALEYPNSWLKGLKPGDDDVDLDYFNYQSTVYGFKILGNVFENPNIVADEARKLGYRLDIDVDKTDQTDQNDQT